VERGLKAEVVEGRRPQLPREVMHLLDELSGQLLQTLQAVARRLPGRRGPQGLEAEHHRREVLAQVVV
jgi:hypothetical protein